MTEDSLIQASRRLSEALEQLGWAVRRETHRIMMPAFRALYALCSRNPARPITSKKRRIRKKYGNIS